MTAPPEDYEPFYLSMYARHGSRWLISPNQYDMPIRTLETIQADGGLTEAGQALLSSLKRLRSLSPDEKLGVLTSLGFEQHKSKGHYRTYYSIPHLQWLIDLTGP